LLQLLTQLLQRCIIIGLNEGFYEHELLGLQFWRMATPVRFGEDISRFAQSLEQILYKTQRHPEAVCQLALRHAVHIIGVNNFFPEV
jgi:fumarate hydratase class II